MLEEKKTRTHFSL